MNEEAEIAVLKAQIQRMVSDIESEKATRSRVSMELFKRIDESDDRTAEKIEELRHDKRSSDRLLYMMLGGWMLIQFIIPLLRK